MANTEGYFKKSVMKIISAFIYFGSVESLETQGIMRKEHYISIISKNNKNIKD